MIEVGLGGRLDSTNVITPRASGVTSIGIDHTQYLGDTREAIAGEKAGIFKPGVPAVIGERDPRCAHCLTARRRGVGAAPVRVLAEEWPGRAACAVAARRHAVHARSRLRGGRDRSIRR